MSMKFLKPLIATAVLFVSVALLVICLIFLKHQQTPSGVSDQNKHREKLLIICVDGVRHDYITRPQLPGFGQLMTSGVSAQFNRPIFPSKTYPNMYTMATGLFAESHGIIDNQMFDDLYLEQFDSAPDPSTSRSHWWDAVEPIWIAAEKNGIRTAMFNWDGCQVSFGGWRATWCWPYRRLAEWDSVDWDTIRGTRDILKSFKNNSVGLGMVYWELPDRIGHIFGPDSLDIHQALIRTSKFLNAVQEDIDLLGLSDLVNVYVISDHGMTAGPFKRIPILKMLNFTKFQEDIHFYYGCDTNYGFFPMTPDVGQRMFDEIKLTNFSDGLEVGHRFDLPERLHLRNRVTPPIFVWTKPGYVFTSDRDNQTFEISTGIHGYEPDETHLMDGVMLAKGPAFKQGHRIGMVMQLDHYQVFCRVLGIEPKPNNGSWDRVKSIFRHLDDGSNDVTMRLSQTSPSTETF